MTISDPNGPFGFNFWLHRHEDHTDLHAGDEFEVGDLNQLTGGDAGNATIIANNRHDNVAFAGQIGTPVQMSWAYTGIAPVPKE